MALDRDQLIKIYVVRLVNSLVPPEFGEEYIQGLASELHAHLINNIHYPQRDSTQQQEAQSLFQHFKRQFLSRGLSGQWITFANILDQLTQLKSVDQIVNYLTFLSHLQQTSWQPSQPPYYPRHDQNSPASMPHSLHSSPYIDPLSNAQTPALQSATLSQPASIHSNPSHRSPIPASTAHSNNPTGFVNSMGIPLPDVIQPYYQSGIPESDVLMYLSYTLLGLDSKIITFHNVINSDLWQVELPPQLNISYRSLLTSIVELGLLYKWLKVTLDAHRGSGGGNSNGKTSSKSPIITAYLRFIQSELTEYVNKINNIFNDVNLSSLLQVYDQVTPMILNFRLLYTLTKDAIAIANDTDGINAAMRGNGYDFLLRIWKLSKFGDSNISQKAASIFQLISIPYYEIIEHWIIKGELTDNNHEFFISFNAEENHINDIIQFHSNRIPDFFTLVNKEIGYKIFQIGKNLIFLNKYCKELHWVNDYNAKYSDFIFNKHQGLKSMDMNLISTLVDHQYQETLNYLTLCIMGPQNKIFNHLIRFKQFLFMNNNDFIESIIQHGLSVFSAPSNSLNSNQLSSILINSINSSTVKHFPAEVVDRLDARILDLSHGNIGWEVFTLDYKVNDLPIYNILNYHQGLLEYLKMFSFLWKLRHLSFLLHAGFVDFNDLWKNDLASMHKKYVKLTRRVAKGDKLNLRESKIVWLIKSFKVVMVIRNQMSSFISVLIRYFSHDLIEECFNKLIVQRIFKSARQVAAKKTSSTLPSTSLPILNKSFAASIQKNHIPGLVKEITQHNVNEFTIDEWCQIHLQYITSITNCQLLVEDNIGKISGESFITNIYSLLEIVFSFIQSAEEFASLVSDYVAITNVEESQRYDKDDANIDIDDDLEMVGDKLKRMMHKLYREIYQREFKSTRELFVKDLRADLNLKELSRFL